MGYGMMEFFDEFFIEEDESIDIDDNNFLSGFFQLQFFHPAFSSKAVYKAIDSGEDRKDDCYSSDVIPEPGVKCKVLVGMECCFDHSGLPPFRLLRQISQLINKCRGPGIRRLRNVPAHFYCT